MYAETPAVEEGFTVTTRVDGKTIQFRQPVTDPFLRHTVTVEMWPVRWLPRLLRQAHVVELVVDADQATMACVFAVLAIPPAERHAHR